MRLLLVSLAACALAAPASAQKFLSATGETSRTTVGALAAEAAAPEGATAETAAAPTEGETPVEGAEGEQVAAATEPEIDEEPAVIDFGDPVESFIPDAGECNPGTLWNQTTGRCETM